MDAMRGDATLFTRNDEVDALWRVVDPILQAWKQDKGEVAQYPAGSDGPELADELIARDGRKWRPL
jgi:glucose-6-phosphate 1-dehydrogenase